jgi:hypothetical protein
MFVQVQIKVPILAVSLELYDDNTKTKNAEVKKVQWFDETSGVGKQVCTRASLRLFPGLNPVCMSKQPPVCTYVTRIPMHDRALGPWKACIDHGRSRRHAHYAQVLRGRGLCDCMVLIIEVLHQLPVLYL